MLLQWGVLPEIVISGPIAWHWPVPAYLVTKGIASGIFLILALSYLLGLASTDTFSNVVTGITSLVFTIITTALLVYDLERPERFLRILFRPQWKSWLVRGAFLLIGFSVISGVWWLLEAGMYWELFAPLPSTTLRSVAFWIGSPLALGAAVYTAFLFGQAEGRDLWQSTLLPVHLVVQAFVAGAASILILAAFFNLDASLVSLSRVVFLTGLIVDLLVTALGEFGMPHASEAAAKAAHEITHGRFKRHFWLGNLTLGHLIPLLLLWANFSWLSALAGLAALIGLYLYEYAFVMAPQEIPNS